VTFGCGWSGGPCLPGLISGIPTETGLFWVSAEARNPLRSLWTGFFLFSIADGTITSPTTAQGIVGVPFTYLITADNNPSWYLASGLPPGVYHAAGSPLIAGIPTEPGTFWLSLEAENLFGTASAFVRLTIANAAKVASSLKPADYDRSVTSSITPVCSTTNRLLGITNNGNGTFTLGFQGTFQAQYYVMTSTSAAAPITTWVPLAGSTNIVTNASGLWNLTVPTSGTVRFYRSVAERLCP
jgi:hypothetical protein